MKPLRLLSVVAAALVLALLPGCQSRYTKTTVLFVSNNAAGEFWLICENGAKKAAQEEDVDLVFRRPPNGTAAEQKDIIDTELAKGVKAVSISVTSPDNQTDFLNTIAAKVPLLAVDNDADKSKRRCYIGTDNVKAGRAVGKLIKEALPDGATIALFVGQIEPLNARERVQGVLEELGIKDTQSEDGKYKLHRKEPYTDDVKTSVAQDNAATVLAQLKDKEKVCLVGLWAYNPPAILAAAKAAKREGKVTIVGFDEDLNTLQGIQDGYIYGTVVQNPYDFGYKSVKAMAKLAKGEKVEFPPDGKDYVPERIITKEGGDGKLKASDYYQQVKTWLGK